MIFSTLAYFIIAILLLVVIHELGHFLMARFFNVKVLCFSFGFGKVLARWHDKKNTEYVWSLIPLGGYVRMLDENEMPVAEEEKHLAFNNKPLYARFLIVLAGPLFNFLFAFLMLWLVAVWGSYTLAPIISTVLNPSIAHDAGLKANDEITVVNGKAIQGWRDFQYALIPFIGSDNAINIQVRARDNTESSHTASLQSWTIQGTRPDILKSLGIIPFIPKLKPIIGEVVSPSAASTAGLQVNDEIISINGKPYDDWFDILAFIKQHPDKAISMVIKRQQDLQEVKIKLGAVKENGVTQGLLGVRSKPADWAKEWIRYERKNPFAAIGYSLKQTVQLTATTFSLMGRFITGKMPLESISGPVGIAQGAGDSGRSSVVDYLSFLAIVSISLGVLNILPIPMLDGGHLLYFLVEFLTGKTVSVSVKTYGAYVGIFLLLMVTVIALKNDLTRIFVP